jgi:hypothetical protein
VNPTESGVKISVRIRIDAVIRKLSVMVWASRQMVRSIVAAIAALLLLWPGSAIAADYNRRVMEGADFSHQDLRDSSFTKAGLREAKFVGSNLQGVSFFAANLESADLTGADLRNSTLDSARISDANLTNANLEGAFAFSVKFERTVITGADFTDVQMREDSRVLLCKTASGVNPVTKRSTRETLFCDE